MPRILEWYIVNLLPPIFIIVCSFAVCGAKEYSNEIWVDCCTLIGVIGSQTRSKVRFNSRSMSKMSVIVMSRIRLSRKEASEQLMSEKKSKTDSDNLNKMPTTSKLRKNRAKLTKKRSSDDNYPSNGSSPQHPSTLPNSSPSHTTYYRTGNRL